MGDPDVVVVGAGPNGLAAAVVLARAGLAVLVVERGRVGGAAATAEVTLPGFRHDLGSAVHPMAVASPFFRRFRLAERIEFRTPERSWVHPFDDGSAAVLWRDLPRTAAGLSGDGPAWQRLLGPLVDEHRAVARLSGSAVLRPPADPRAFAAFGLRALEQGTPAWNLRWRGRAAPALLAGAAAHTIRPMPSIASTAAGLALTVAAHAGGWPIPVGGSGAIIDALAADLLAHGGRIETGRDIRGPADLPRAKAVVFDTGVPALLRIVGGRLAAPVRLWLRTIRTGDGIGKLDLALDGPVPWRNADARRTVTLHLGGTRDDIAAGEAEVARGRVPARPFVLVCQPSVLDPTRAPGGRHVLWAYTHLPAGSRVDPTEPIVGAIEALAPGFRDRILATSARSAADVAAWNPNFGGGDIAAGAITLRQLVARPLPSPEPWSLGGGVFICSGAAAPGPGVHGMGGYLAARSVLRHMFGIRTPPSLAPEVTAPQPTP